MDIININESTTPRAAGANSAKKAEPANNENGAAAGNKLGFASLGICCTLAWAFLVNAIGSSAPTAQSSWQISYLVLSAVIIAFGFVGAKKPAFVASFAASCTAAVLGGAGAALLIASFAMPALAPAQTPAAIMCSCVLGWLYLQWSDFYVRLGIREATGCLFAGNIAASLIKGVAHFSPTPLFCIIAVALPAASVFMCRKALSSAPAEARSAKLESHNLGNLWKAALAVAALSFVTAFLVGRSFGNQSAAPTEVFLLGRVFEALISAVVLFVVLGLGKTFNFAQLWRIVLTVLAIDLLCQVLLPQVSVIRCIESSAWDLLVSFVWLTVVDVAHHAKTDHRIVVGIGWAIYTASFAVGSMIQSAIAPAQTSIVSTTVLMFVLVLVGTFCLEVRDQDVKWIFAEFSGERTVAPQNNQSIDERCEAIAAEHGLTPRELEVMKMLCKGRTKSYIAETLYLTENTVRSHTKHIYSKLDVHSKQELIDLTDL